MGRKTDSGRLKGNAYFLEEETFRGGVTKRIIRCNSLHILENYCRNIILIRFNKENSSYIILLSSCLRHLTQQVASGTNLRQKSMHPSAS